MSKTNHIPNGLPALVTQLVVENARGFIDFARVLGFEEAGVMDGPGGAIMHGHLRRSDASLFVSDAGGFARPTSANIFLYVEDVDAAYGRAVEAGAKPMAPVSDMFWGDRWGMLEDPFGNIWQLATHVEDVPPEEMQARMAAQTAGGSGS